MGMGKRNEVVLLYHMTDEEKAKKIKRVLLLMGVKMKMIAPEQYDCLIEELLKPASQMVKNQEKEKKKATQNTLDTMDTVNVIDAINVVDVVDAVDVQDTADAIDTADMQNVGDIESEMMVLYGFSGNRLDELLYALRKNQARVDLKAVVTESNKTWTSRALYQELLKEHTMMQKNAKTE